MSSESENNLTTKEEDFKTISTNTKDPDYNTLEESKDSDYNTSEESDQSKDPSEESDQSKDDSDENTENPNIYLKDSSEIFVVSVDGVPQFYTKNIENAREQMYNFAKMLRIKETQYNTYIRGCSNKNYIELIGCHKFSVFFVDRTICRLLVSQVQEVKIQ